MSSRTSKQAIKRNMAVTRRVMRETAFNPDNHGLERVSRMDPGRVFPMLGTHENERLERFAERLGWMDGIANVYVEEGDGQISFFTVATAEPAALVHVDAQWHGEFLGDLLDRLYELPEGEYAEYSRDQEHWFYLSGVSKFLGPEELD
jgi:hypothetical protein